MAHLKHCCWLRFIYVFLLLAAISAPGLAQAPPVPPVAPANPLNPASQPPKPHPEVQALLDKGMVAYRTRDFHEAQRLFTEALDKARSGKDAIGEIEGLSSIGLAQSGKGEWDQAIKTQEQALSLSQAIGYKVGVSDALTNLAGAYLGLRQPEKAITYQQQVLKLHRETGDKAREAQLLVSIGNAYYSLGQREKALETFQQALPLYRQVGNKTGEANVLTNMGIVYNGLRQPQKALEWFQQALPVIREVKDRRREAQVLVNIGFVYSNIGQPEKALEHFQQALPLYREIKNRPSEVHVLKNIASVYREMGQPQKALEYYQQTLLLGRELGDKKGGAWILHDVGYTYRGMGQPQKALEYAREAMLVFQTVGDKGGEAAGLFLIGLVYTGTGEPAKALENFQPALTLFRAVGDKGGEASTLNMLGIACSGIGELALALSYHQQALALCRANGNKSGQAEALKMLGLVYRGFRRFDKELEYYRQALALKQAVNEPLDPGLLTHLGLAYKDLGQLPKAMDYYQQALRLYRADGSKSADAPGVRGMLGLIGATYTAMGQPRKAVEYVQQALPLHRAAGDKQSEAYALRDLGSAYQDLGQLQKAIDHYRQAVVGHRMASDRVAEAFTLTLISDCEKQRGRFADAERHLRESLLIVENMRATLGGMSEAKVNFLGGQTSTYHSYITLLLERNRPADAFAVAQKTKARALLDLMASSRVDIRQQMTQAEKQQEQELRGRADQLNAQMVKEGVQNEVGAKKRFAALKTQLTQAESDLQTFTDTLYARRPDLARKRAATTATLASVGNLLPADTAVLEYLVRREGVGKKAVDTIVLFVVTRQPARAGTAAATVRTYSIPVPGATLAGKADALRAACADPRKPYRVQAQEMYRLLLPPAAARHLAGKKRLIVCPDGPLWDVPFAALRDARGRFLLERFELAFAYSATGAQATLLRPGHQDRNNRNKAISTKTLIAMANPDFGGEKRFGDDMTIAGQRPIAAPSRPIAAPSRGLMRAFAATRGGRIVDLPGTRKEADMLRRRFPGASIYTGSRAQERQLKKQAGSGYRYLHLASHAFFNDTASLLSSVVLASPSAGSGDDGFLTAREIFDLNLSGTEMVVLSACNTARGETHTGEGIVGLTWALFVAGVPTQVLSQWSVDDAGTATLMDQFYGRLTQGDAKGEALRKAALSLRRDKKHSHPYYWAPFVLMGNWKK